MPRPRRLRNPKILPAARPGGMGREDRDHENGILQPTREHGFDYLVERNPAHFDAGFFLRALKHLIRRADPACEKHTDHFVASPGRGRELGQQRPVLGDEVCFLRKLTLCGEGRGFTRDIEQPGRKLPIPHPNGMAILLDEKHTIPLVKGKNRDRARVRDKLS